MMFPIDHIIQGGCAGIALMVLYFGYRLASQVMKIASNHLQHIAESLGQMSAKMDVLINRTSEPGPRGRKGDRGKPGKDA
jgi:hypothetical protein